MLETARGGIIRRGLGYDWSDIGVMTNISDDHLGQDGIKSVEDVLYIKSLVAERVKEGGTLVLNADDEHLAKLMENERVSKVPKTTVYFAIDENNPVVRSHLQAGAKLTLLRNNALIESIGEVQRTSRGRFDVAGGDERNSAVSDRQLTRGDCGVSRVWN